MPHFLRLRAIPALLSLAAAHAAAATFTVLNTNDSGAGSLRQAILDANGNPGPDAIDFAIPGSGVHTISPTSALPVITEPVTIDGYTQTGASPNTDVNDDNAVLLIEVDGTNAGNVKGFVLDGGGSLIRGLVINRFASTGIEVHSDLNLVQGNFVGTDPAGTAALPNGSGVLVLFGGSGNGNRIGGTTPQARNLISGNTGAGVGVAFSGNHVEGNFIGVDATGAAALGNGDRGVSVNGSANVVGGATAAFRNIVSGNNRGVQFDGSDHVLQSNYIGTDSTGTLPLPNQNEGVSVNSATGVLLGGAAVIPGTPPGNIISGNTGAGVDLFAGATGTRIQGNEIGIDASLMFAMGNSLDGIVVAGSSNTIGGVNAGEGNAIAYNGTNGIEVGEGAYTGNAIRGNSIFGNGKLAIDLRQPADGTGGPSPNDTLDADTGANNLQNFPLVTSVLYQIGHTTVGIVFDGAADTTFDIDFYANPVCSSRPHDFLEGGSYIGSGQFSTDGTGHAAFDAILSVTLQPGQPVTVTATDPAGNTSELSPRLPFSISPVSGPADGGTEVTIAGTSFASGVAVTFGGVAATNVSVTDSTQIMATTPALSPGVAYDVTVTNTDASNGTLSKGFVTDFLDVPPSHQFHGFVTTLVSNAITAGIGGGLYGVGEDTLRQQMAVFLLKGYHGLCFVPPPCTGTFSDVPCPSTFADWIEELAAEQITGGCGGGNFCPQNPVRRDQMAVFLLKAEHGHSYTPPSCVGIFPDVPCPSQFADWIEQLAAEQITGGCGNGNYCPLSNNTRGQMAVFITKTFNLQ